MLLVQRKAAVFVSLALIFALGGCGGMSCSGDSGSATSGGGGGGGAGGPIASGVSFSDAFLRPVTTTLASGSDLVLSASGLAANSSIEALVFGPGEKITLPSGESVCGYLKLSTTKTGSLPATLLMHRPADGSYQVKMRYAGTRAEEGVTAITVAPQAGRPNLKVGRFDSGAVTEAQTLQVGLNMGVAGTGFTPGQADVYVVEYDPTGTLGGTLFDISGFVSDGTIASGRGLEGTAETVTIGEDGMLQAREIWRSVSPQAVGKVMEVVVDVNRDGKFDSTVDYRHSPMLGSLAVLPASDRATGSQDYDLASDGANLKTLFQFNDTVYCPTYRGDAAENNVLVNAYVIKLDQAKSDQTPLVDVSGPAGSSQPETYYRPKGNNFYFTKASIYQPDIRAGEYAIVLDMDGDSILDRNTDVIDGFDGDAAFETSASTSRQKWTVMVYVDADNDLEDELMVDLDEMETPAYLNASGESDVTVCVQFDRTPGNDTSNGDWTTTRRFIMATDQQPGIIATNHVEDLGEQDMGDPNTLRSFVNWAKGAAPADRYMLIINSHGNGPRSRSVGSSITRGVGFDMSSGNSLLTPSELSGVLRGIGGVDVLGFDACLMGSTEVLAQLHGLTDYVVASELLFPGLSYDYETLLKGLVADPDMTPRELAIHTVDSNRPQYASTDDVVLSAFDMAQVPELVDTIKFMATSFYDVRPGWSGPAPMYYEPGIWSSLLTARDVGNVGRLLEHDTGVFRTEYDDLVDLGKLMDFVAAETEDSMYGSLATQVKLSMQKVIISQLISSNRSTSHTGLSIWLPDLNDHLDGKVAYKQLTLSRETKWDELIEKVTQARGFVTVTTTPISGPFNGFSIVEHPAAELTANQWTTGQAADSGTSIGLAVRGGTGFVITDLPITEDYAVGVILTPPDDWVSPPRWRIEIGKTFALFRDVPFPSNNMQTESEFGWYDRQGINWNWWFPFKISKDGDVTVLNSGLSYGL